MEKINGISSPTFAVDDFSRLFLHPFIFPIKDSRSAKIIKGCFIRFMVVIKL